MIRYASCNDCKNIIKTSDDMADYEWCDCGRYPNPVQPRFYACGKFKIKEYLKPAILVVHYEGDGFHKIRTIYIDIEEEENAFMIKKSIEKINNIFK